MGKITAAILTLIVLASLLTWQWRRERAIGACYAQGGSWSGLESKCRAQPGRITIQRDLFRI